MYFWSTPLAGLLIFAAALPARPGLAGFRPIAAENFTGPVEASVERVVDGDTIDVRAFIWLGQSLTVRVRIDGMDTPELKGACPEERKAAEAARLYLERRLAPGKVVLSRIAYDKYGGRVRAEVRDVKGDIAGALIGAGLARPYHGERRKPWCAAA